MFTQNNIRKMNKIIIMLVMALAKCNRLLNIFQLTDSYIEF